MVRVAVRPGAMALAASALTLAGAQAAGAAPARPPGVSAPVDPAGVPRASVAQAPVLPASVSSDPASPAPEEHCGATWTAQSAHARPGPLDAAALLALRDIGSPDPAIGGPSPLAVSPDGGRVAFFLAQASLAANDVCESLVVLDLDHPGHVRVLDSGAARIRLDDSVRGLRREGGVPDVNQPQWSPDGTRLAYRKRPAERTQVWGVASVGGPARPLAAPAWVFLIDR